MNARRKFVVGAASALAANALWRSAAPAQRAEAPAASPGVLPEAGAPSAARAPAAPMPQLGPTGVLHDGQSVGAFGIDPARNHPDVRSHRLKIGVLLPATNTSVEHELWRLVFDNREALAGVGLHTTPVVTQRPTLRNERDLEAYKQQFVGGLSAAIDHALLAQPGTLLMGMSLEHILYGLPAIRKVMAHATAKTRLPWATWHDAAHAALRALGARRIGLITPFDARGNENAARMFKDLGMEVISSVGFACADALHIAHIPDHAKDRAIVELLATKKNRLDAVVQCGTNMSFVDVAERLEPRLGLPLLSINAVTFWYALRQSGFSAPLQNGGRLLREH